VDVDHSFGTIAVARSYDGETTKGGHADLIPIADGLRPYHVAAIERARVPARGRRDESA
jgi:hypothetical protein